MPIIVLASPKGGVGKSTTTLVLATELAIRGASITVIDADRNKPLVRWAKREGRPPNITVISDIDEQTIIDTIENAAATTQFVLVDLEGTASTTAAFAISRADLVIIPTQGSEVDGVEAFKAVQLVQVQEKAFRRRIPYTVLFTRVNAAVTTRDFKDIYRQLTDVGVPIIKTRMVERAAFRALFSFGGTLHDLDPSQVSNLPAANANATRLVAEVIEMLQATKKERAA